MAFAAMRFHSCLGSGLCARHHHLFTADNFMQNFCDNDTKALLQVVNGGDEALAATAASPGGRGRVCRRDCSDKNAKRLELKNPPVTKAGGWVIHSV